MHFFNYNVVKLLRQDCQLLNNQISELEIPSFKYKLGVAARLMAFLIGGGALVYGFDNLAAEENDRMQKLGNGTTCALGSLIYIAGIFTPELMNWNIFKARKHWLDKLKTHRDNIVLVENDDLFIALSHPIVERKIIEHIDALIKEIEKTQINKEAIVFHINQIDSLSERDLEAGSSQNPNTHFIANRRTHSCPDLLISDEERRPLLRKL